MYAAAAHDGVMDDYDEHGFPLETAFIDNGIALDPPDCGCLDCGLGHAIPFDVGRTDALAQAALGGRRVYNRTGLDLVLVVRHDGTASFEELTGRTVIAAYAVK